MRRGWLDDLYGAPLRWAGLGLMAIPLLGALGLLLFEDRAPLLAVTVALAGLTVAVVLIPQSMAYAVLAGMPASTAFMPRPWHPVWQPSGGVSASLPQAPLR